MFLVFRRDVSVANDNSEDTDVAKGNGAEWYEPSGAEENENEVSRREFFGEIIEAAACEIALGNVVAVADVEGRNRREGARVEPRADRHEARPDRCEGPQRLQRPDHGPVAIQRDG